MKRLLSLAFCLFAPLSASAYIENLSERKLNSDEKLALYLNDEEECMTCGPNEAGHVLVHVGIAYESAVLTVFRFETAQVFDDDFGFRCLPIYKMPLEERRKSACIEVREVAVAAYYLKRGAEKAPIKYKNYDEERVYSNTHSFRGF